MKGTEKIIAHIQADAKAQADAILAQAEQQCAAIREAYEAKAQEQYAENLAAGVKLCEDKVDRAMRIAQMEARKALLVVKQEMVSAGFDKACEKLVNLPQQEYTELLAKLAAQTAVSGDEEIVLNARDKAAVGAAVVEAANARLGARGLQPQLKLAENTGNFAGGFVLHRGSIDINCTAELLVELRRGDMAAELAGVLFA